MWNYPSGALMSESVVPIFRALGPLETYLSELYTHNFGTIGCAIWVDTDVGFCITISIFSRWGSHLELLVYYSVGNEDVFSFIHSMRALKWNPSSWSFTPFPWYKSLEIWNRNLHTSGTLINRESTPSTRVHPNHHTAPPTLYQTEWMAGACVQQDARDCYWFQLCSGGWLEPDLSWSFQVQLQRRKW